MKMKFYILIVLKKKRIEFFFVLLVNYFLTKVILR